MHSNKRSFLLRPLLVLLSILGLGFVPALSAVQAQELENLGTFKFWTAWKGSDSNGVMCFVSSQPQSALPSNVNRDPIHFLVINRKGLGTRNEAQTIVGYPLAANSTPTVSVDGKGYDMVVEGSAAWLASASDEPGFVAAMKAGSTMIVKARSQRGTDTTDTYSLSGVTAAMEKVSQACG
ncbi:MAG: invasion associated locus B family protein [Devosiaceae bacterium]|nr:invasion associated locus B family protein [Devosiaceae bacterium]